MRNDGSTSKTQVAFTWTAPASNGGATVLDYAIEMDDNNDGIYTQVASGVTSTSHTQTGLSEGTSYMFKVRARNSVGYSTYSSPFTIVAATKPDVPTSFLRNESSTTKTQVAFSWDAPSDTGGSSLIDYSLEMSTSENGSYTEVATGVTATEHI